MEIADFTFYIIDPDMRRRNAFARLLEARSRSVPLDKVSELGPVLATSPCFLVHDDHDQVVAILKKAITQGNSPPVLVYSAHPDLDRLYEVTDMGAAGCFTYDVDCENPSEHILRLLKRDARMQKVRQRRQVAASKLQLLTRREHEVLVAVSRGESNKVIAREMCVSPRTVEVHRRNMIAKLDVPCSITAVRVALEAEL